VGKNKLAKFADMDNFSNVVQPSFEDAFHDNFKYKGNWSGYFGNDNPITLELGCGKGEYTVALAEEHPGGNYIGIDIKGARIWRGAKTALEKKLQNVAFVRTRVDFIPSIFGPGEVDEIWITFPDPQLKKSRTKKRLTSPRFLNAYKALLKKDGIVHLKTDNQVLHEYTADLLTYNNCKILARTNDLYHSDLEKETRGIRTFYENMFLEEGLPITYLKFQLNDGKKIEEKPGED
jgi:tRNA (guanine-N7-)-methyltransferase